MNIELRFKEREVIKRVDGDGPFPVIVKILQTRICLDHYVIYGTNEPVIQRTTGEWTDVPCVGVDDE